jgi:hypothetical protein
MVVYASPLRPNGKNGQPSSNWGNTFREKASHKRERLTRAEIIDFKESLWKGQGFWAI